jgi:hypothetical protein
MNRWIEHNENLYNLDRFSSIFLNHDEVVLFLGDLENHLCFDCEEEDNVKSAEELYEKIKSKLNLTEWE